MQQQMNMQLNFGILYMNIKIKIIFLENNQFNGQNIMKLLYLKKMIQMFMLIVTQFIIMIIQFIQEILLKVIINGII